jgi:hypothetical protein
MNFINFSNQKVGLNTYFLVGFQCIFVSTFKTHLLLILLELDSYKLNRAN